MKLCDFNNKNVIPLLAKILLEEKTCLLMDDFFFLFYFTDSKVGKTLIDNTFLN